jgi:hypothetical protein
MAVRVSAGSRISVDSLDVAGAVPRLDASCWHPKLEGALAERYTHEEILVRVVDIDG